MYRDAAAAADPCRTDGRDSRFLEAVAVDVAVHAETEARARCDVARRGGVDLLIGARLDDYHSVRGLLGEVDVGRVPDVERRIRLVDDRVVLAARGTARLVVVVVALAVELGRALGQERLSGQLDRAVAGDSPEPVRARLTASDRGLLRGEVDLARDGGHGDVRRSARAF